MEVLLAALAVYVASGASWQIVVGPAENVVDPVKAFPFPVTCKFSTGAPPPLMAIFPLLAPAANGEKRTYIICEKLPVWLKVNDEVYEFPEVKLYS
jgi:hypothetical protein